MTERIAWTSLAAFVPFGPVRLKLIIKYFGSANDAWKASIKQYADIGLSQKLVSQFDKFRREFNPNGYIDRLRSLAIGVYTSEDEDYPKRLKSIDDYPQILYVRISKSGYGLQQLLENAIAVVGTRKMTSYGKEACVRIVSDLSISGITIVSGLALGIDAMAHRTALETGGATVAVLGNGLDQIYPPSNKGLGEMIVKSGKGALLSEYPLGYPVLPQNFPQRNRIESGISQAVLVVEGTEKSGTLITAASAASQGRDVFAVPGPITSSTSRAPHFLIKNGAKLVESGKEILEELDINTKDINDRREARRVIPVTVSEKQVLEALEKESMGVDSLVRVTGASITGILSSLTTLELKGMVKNIGGEYIKVT